MGKKELTCICCPMGCALSVELEGSNVLTVKGNTCKRGDTYARDGYFYSKSKKWTIKNASCKN